MPLCLVKSIPVVAMSKGAAVAPRLLVLWVRITPGAWMLVSRGCCVLSGKGL